MKKLFFVLAITFIAVLVSVSVKAQNENAVKAPEQNGPLTQGPTESKAPVALITQSNELHKTATEQSSLNDSKLQPVKGEDPAPVKTAEAIQLPSTNMITPAQRPATKNG